MVCDDITNPFPSELLMTALSDGSSLLELYLVCCQCLSGDSVVLMLAYDMFISSYIMLGHWSVIALHLLYSHTDRYFHFSQTEREQERENSIPDA